MKAKPRKDLVATVMEALGLDPAVPWHTVHIQVHEDRQQLLVSASAGDGLEVTQHTVQLTLGEGQETKDEQSA